MVTQFEVPRNEHEMFGHEPGASNYYMARNGCSTSAESLGYALIFGSLTAKEEAEDVIGLWKILARHPTGGAAST
jgi:hypothetical protein